MATSKQEFDCKAVHDALPDTPSALIRVALADMNRVRKLKRVHLDMNYWHVWDKKRFGDALHVCRVCMAGAVMHGTLKVPVYVSAMPYYFERRIEYKLESLDSFRCGLVAEGVRQFYSVAREKSIDIDETLKRLPQNEPVTVYSEATHHRFVADMERIAALLEGHGL